VGLTLAVTLARKGFTVHGVDTSPAVLDALGQGPAAPLRARARRGPRHVSG